MASSQVEIASSSPPFGCALRDRNRQDKCKESNVVRANLQKNFVRDRHSCIISDTNGDSSVYNEQKNNDEVVKFQEKKKNNNNEVDKTQENKSKIQQRWAQAREMVCNNNPKFENGVKKYKKAKLTREMACNMLQIDNEDFSIKGTKQNTEKDKKQKKPKARETEQGSIKDKNQNDQLKEMVSNILQIDNLDRSAKVDNEKNHELKLIREIVSSQLQNDTERFQKKLKIQERWVRAREKVCNQSQSDNIVSIGQSKQSNHKKPDSTSALSAQSEEYKINDKNQKASKNQERWARVRENVSKKSQINRNVDSIDQSNKNDNKEDCSIKENKDQKFKKSKNNKEVCSIQEETKNKDNNHKKSNRSTEDIHVQKESKCEDQNLKKLRTQDRWARAREMVSNRKGVSSPLLGCGVSSLLQKWEGYEAEAKSLNSHISTNTSPGCSVKSNSGITFIDNSPPRTSPCSEYSESISSDERDNNARSTTIDPIPDWESDKVSLSGPHSYISRDSDIATEEKDKVRVVDLIRKLTSSNEDIREGEQMLASDESLPKAGTEILSCPRVRGRQAFNNLLMRIERDRERELENLGERKAVSNFSHKGRIQALLKVKLMHRLAQTQDRDTPDSPVKANLNRGPQGSHIMHLREIFCVGCEHGSKETTENAASTKNSSCTSSKINEESCQHDGDDKRNLCRNLIDKIKDKENHTSGPNQPKEETHHGDVTDPKDCTLYDVHEVKRVEESLSTNRRTKENTCKVENQRKVVEESINIVLESSSHDVCNIATLDEDINDDNERGSDRDRMKEISHAHTIWEDIESCHDWLSDISQFRSEWEQMCNDQQLVETNHDWMSEVSRPQSDWEDLRQARYQEMLDPYAHNGDIRQLLERKSVSSFLSSDTRDAIERLMLARMQKQSPQVRTLGTICKEEAEEDMYDQLRYDDHSSDDNDDGNWQLVDELFEEPYEDTNRAYPPEPHSQSLLSPWMDIQDIAVSDYSNQSSPYSQEIGVCNSPFRDNDQHFSSFINSPSNASTYTQELGLCNSPFRDNDQHLSSFISSPSTEMELIYDLRGHMEQLHQEMYEMQKSIRSCINMQVKLQHSIKCSVSEQEKGLGRRATRKGKCRICNEKAIDSLLYRCGHMCTCFKCAHDLQMSTGRCPVCQAPILDIVRPCTDNHRMPS